MRTVKQIFKVLMLAAILTGFGRLLPGFTALYDNYLVGFLLTVVAILIFLVFFKAHMARVAKLPPDVREKREKESQKWWKETSEATFSPSCDHDLRNIYHDD